MLDSKPDAKLNEATDTHSESHIDDALFEEMRELLEEDFKPLVQDYMQGSVERVHQLRDALAKEDNALGLDVAHAQKGAGANLGLIYLSKLCAQMQNLCHDKSIATGASLIDEIANEVNLTNTLIQQRLDS